MYSIQVDDIELTTEDSKVILSMSEMKQEVEKAVSRLNIEDASALECLALNIAIMQAMKCKSHYSDQSLRRSTVTEHSPGSWPLPPWPGATSK